MSKTIIDFEGDIQKIAEAVRDPEYLQQAGGFIRDAAKMLCSGFKVSGGELRNSISLTITQEDNSLTAHVGTNKEYAMYVEHGTGPKGMANHEGTSPDFQPTYRTSPWWIHESQVDPQAAEEYHWFHIDTKDGRFYKVTGQPAHPYLYPAVKDNEKTIVDILRAGWEGAIQE